MLDAVATARRAPTTCECGAPVPWGSHFCAELRPPGRRRARRRLRGLRSSAPGRRQLLRAAAADRSRPSRESRSRGRGRSRAGASETSSPRSTRRSCTRPIPGSARLARPRTNGAAHAAARRTARARSTASSAASGCPRGRASSRRSARAGAGGSAGTPATGSGRPCSRSSSRSSAGVVSAVWLADDSSSASDTIVARPPAHDEHPRRPRPRPSRRRRRPPQPRPRPRRRRLRRPRSHARHLARRRRAAGRSCSTRCRPRTGAPEPLARGQAGAARWA